MSPTDFYIATDFAKKDVAHVLAERIQLVTPLTLRARWIINQPAYKDGGLGGELRDDEASAARRVAQEDLEDIACSNLFIQLTSGEKARGGRQVELGYALGRSLQEKFFTIVVCGPREHAFHYHPHVTHVPDQDQLISWLKGYSAGAGL